MSDAIQEQSEREVHMRALASQLEFTVRKIGDLFTLTRTVDISPPEHKERLTLEQAECLLETWKLRGHGS